MDRKLSSMFSCVYFVFVFAAETNDLVYIYKYRFVKDGG